MIVLMLLTALAGVYSFLFYFTNLSLWFYFLWVPLSLVMSLITYVLFVVIIFQFLKKGDPKGKFRHWLLHQTCFMMLFCARVKVKVIGKEYVPNSPFVCYANHKSDVDPIILYYSMHKICSAVGKKSLFKYPIINQCQQVFGVISLDRENDREAAKSIISAIRNIKAGLSYIIFPEGGIKTRETEEMNDLRAGAYKLVTKTGVPLLVASIIGSSNTKKRKCFLKKVKVTVIFHEPILSSEYDSMNTIEIGQKVINIVNQDIINKN